MKLYQLPRGSRLRLQTDRGEAMATFYLVDGMYSLSVLDGDGPERERIVHLKAWTEVVLRDGAYEVAEAS